MSRGLQDTDDEFSSVSIATTNIKYFTDSYQTFDIGRKGAIALILNNGTRSHDVRCYTTRLART